MPEKPSLTRKQIYLTPQLNRRLRQAAAHSGETESALVREALEEYLAGEERRRTPKEENPVLQMAGMFEGGPDCQDVSTRIDEYLVRSHGRKRE